MPNLIDMLRGGVDTLTTARGAYKQAQERDAEKQYSLLDRLKQQQVAQQAAQQQAEMLPLRRRLLEAQAADAEAQAKARLNPVQKVADPYGGRTREQWIKDEQEIAGIRRPPKAPVDKQAPTQVVVTPDGITIVNKDDATSRRVAAPGEVAGPDGQLQGVQRNPLKAKAIENRGKLRTIDSALRELAANPQAVGLKRGIPIIGDIVNQRYDEKGIRARAAIADIGSLVLHTRSGASVTINEWPRLAPFIPKITDSPEAVTVKLKRMKELIEAETAELEAGGGGGATAAGASDAVDPVLSKYGLTPKP